MSRIPRISTAITSAILAAASVSCGGGNGGGSNNNPDTPPPAVNQPPVVRIEMPKDFSPPAVDLDTITLKAAASDADNDKLAYTWKQTAGPSASLDGQNTAALTVRLPLVAENTEVTFEVAADDGKGGTTRASKAFTVRPGKMMIINGGLDTTDLSEIFRLHEIDTQPVKLHPDRVPPVDTEISTADYVLTPDRQRVVFLAALDEESLHQVHVAAVDGSGERVVGDPFDRITVERPLSASGRYYASFGEYEELGFNEVRVIDVVDASASVVRLATLDLGEGVPASPLPVEGHEWHPKEDWLAFTRQPSSEKPAAAYVLDVSTGNVRRVSREPFSTFGVEKDIAWSPTGDLLAFRGKLDTNVYSVYVVDAKATNGGGSRRVTGSVSANSFAWSPKGTHIAFNAKPAGSTNEQLYLASTTANDGDEAAQYPVIYTAGYSGSIDSLTWSPDGAHIAFRADTKGRRIFQAYILDVSAARGTAPARVSGTVGTDMHEGAHHLAWSPDSKKLGMRVTVEHVPSPWTQRQALRIARADAVDGTEPVEISMPVAGTEGLLGVTDFAWSPSGGHIAWTVQDDGYPDGMLVHLYAASASATDASQAVRMTHGMTGAPTFGVQRMHWLKSDDELLFLGRVAHSAKETIQKVSVNDTSTDYEMLLEPALEGAWFWDTPILSNY